MDVGTRSQDRILVEDHTRPLVNVSLVMPFGMLADPPGKEGLAHLTAQMLLRGAGSWSQLDVARALDQLGARFYGSVSRETTTLGGDCLSRHLDAFEAIVTRLVTEPTFAPDELDKLKRQVLAEIIESRDHDASVGQQFFVRRLFAGHPYGRAVHGTEASIAAITRQDVVDFHGRHYGPQGLLETACGDITEERLDRFVEATVGALSPREMLPNEVPPLPAQSGYRVTCVDKPERSQTQVFIGQPMIHANHPDFMPMLVGHTLFGGTFTARLSHEIREKRGWSYGAYSYLACDRWLGTYVMRFYPGVEDTVKAMQLCDSLFQSLHGGGATEDEVANAKRYLVCSHPLGIETPEKELQQRVGLRLQGRPDDWLERFVPDVEAVTLGDVNRALRAHLTPGDLTVTVVCTAADLADSLGVWDGVASLEVVDYRGE